jgi:hypothetical protein
LAWQRLAAASPVRAADRRRADFMNDFIKPPI